ncbi:PDZ domain-containing protein [Sphingomonas endophytica]|uniref:PDZ domain-containing protein n=1 Tax=Sphingomonas endophytica TaxID=869719 RepID=A0A147HUW7_9SPHN|nr:PDZ domain-containing protein [Sphingomonas endophytica]KTT68721.1 hypothetical protein NS334_16070 [Sphingomonas endophytica]
MPTVPPARHRAPRTDPDLRAVGLLALALVLAAALAGMVWSRSLGGYAPLHGSDLVGATFAPGGPDLVVVNSVRADGAARRGGLQVGDLIEAIDGAAVPTVDAADRALIGQKLDIRVRRGKREIDLHLDATGGAPLGQQDPADRG